MGHLHAQRGRQTISHGAEATRCHPPVRLLEVKILRCPHLVLAHLSGDIDIMPGRHLAQAADRMLRLDDAAFLAESQTVTLAPFIDLAPPFFQ